MPAQLKGSKRDDAGKIIPIREVFTQSDIDRFWAKVQTAGPDECWLWTSACGAAGYGEYRICENNIRYRYRAHRIAYALSVGFPEGHEQEDIVIRHTCDNRLCVNPAHLESGSHSDNVRDRVERNRSAKGSKNGRAKLTEEGVKIARYCMNELGIDHRVLAKVAGMDPTCFRKIKDGEMWKDIA